MIKKITFNKIDSNYVSKYEYKVINNENNEIIDTGYIENTNNGPTLFTKKLNYNENNTYFVDEHIYYNDFYDISLYIDDNLVDNINIEYNILTKTFFLNNVNNINYINNINKNSDIIINYYKNIIEYELDIPDDCNIIITPILYNRHYIGNHNIIY